MPQATELFVDPDTFFRDKAENPALFGSVSVVSLAIIISILSQIILLLNIQTKIPDKYLSAINIGMIFGGLSSAASIIFIWLVYSSIFQVISRIFNGDGSFRQTFIASGWGFFPLIVSGVVSIILIQILGIDATITLGDVQQSASPQSLVNNAPALRYGKAIGMVCSVWSWFLWSFGLKHSRNINLSQAMISTGIPVGVTLLWEIISFI